VCKLVPLYITIRLICNLRAIDATWFRGAHKEKFSIVLKLHFSTLFQLIPSCIFSNKHFKILVCKNIP